MDNTIINSCDVFQNFTDIITIWNFINKPGFLFKMNANHAKLHTMKFFNTYLLNIILQKIKYKSKITFVMLIKY